MRVYTWLPLKSKNYVGHMAIEIGNEYFSFNPNRNEQNAEYELWNTLEQDKNSFGKEADEIININVDRIFHPYIFDTFNPSGNYYRGLGGWYYNLFKNNCCHVVGHFMSRAIFPYLIDIFGDSDKDDYWLKWESINRHARLEKIKSLYFKYNLYSEIPINNPLEYLFHWQEFDMYKKAIYYLHGPSAAQSAASTYSLPDEHYLFNPGSFIHYVAYAEAVVEDLSGRVPSIPWIYEYEQSDYGHSRKREIKEFKRQIIGIKGAKLKFPRLATNLDFAVSSLVHFFDPYGELMR